MLKTDRKLSMNHYCSNKTLFLGLASLCLFASGCNKVDPPPFLGNSVQMATNEISPEYQQEIADVLGALFGTPDEPFVLPGTGLDAGKLRMSAGPAWSDKKGVHHGLYRKHCVHCHGITGDGRGPTGRFLNPYPRDYRQGVFKFKSTYNAARPTDEDLHIVLVNGIPGTAMPSFSLLPSSEMESLMEYVKYLSIRGELETALIAYVFDELGEEEVEDDDGNPVFDEDGNPKTERPALDPIANAEQREVINEMLADIVTAWEDAESFVIVPVENEIPEDNRSEEELLASIEIGRKLFLGKRANCLECHGPTALGDGQQTDHDLWNKAHLKFLTDNENKVESLVKLSKRRSEEKDAEAKAEIDGQLASDSQLLVSREDVGETLYPVRNAIPRNLRKGIYRGGLRRIDIFRRIAAGIPGTPMPASGATSPGGKGTITEQEIWHLVDYVYSLPYEAPSQPQQALPVNEEHKF